MTVASPREPRQLGFGGPRVFPLAHECMGDHGRRRSSNCWRAICRGGAAQLEQRFAKGWGRVDSEPGERKAWLQKRATQVGRSMERDSPAGPQLADPVSEESVTGQARSREGRERRRNLGCA